MSISGTHEDGLSPSLAVQDETEVLRQLDRLASLLDDRFRIPGTRIRFGLDPLIGLIPGLGDAVTTGLSTWLWFEARRLGVPKRVRVWMLWNIAIDTATGLVPLVGDLLDVGFKANRRNVNLILEHLRARDRGV
jgi:hypothetical protein